MGIRLTAHDEGVHDPGDQINWNESRYIDFWDPRGRSGGWFRIGARPNAHYAEMSACLFLPDGRVAFAFSRAEIEANGLDAGGQTWEIVEPWRTTRVGFAGPMSLFTDPWVLTNPKRAFTDSPSAEAMIDLVCTTEGLERDDGSGPGPAPPDLPARPGRLPLSAHDARGRHRSNRRRLLRRRRTWRQGPLVGPA